MSEGPEKPKGAKILNFEERARDLARPVGREQGPREVKEGEVIDFALLVDNLGKKESWSEAQKNGIWKEMSEGFHRDFKTQKVQEFFPGVSATLLDTMLDKCLFSLQDEEGSSHFNETQEGLLKAKTLTHGALANAILASRNSITAHTAPQVLAYIEQLYARLRKYPFI